MIHIESAADNILKLIADPKYWWYHSRFLANFTHLYTVGIKISSVLYILKGVDHETSEMLVLIWQILWNF